MKVVRQAIRGCGNLPHVGDHPGMPLLAILTGLGAVAGIDNGLPGVLLGGVSMFCVIGIMCLFGAHSRAELSDRLTERAKA